MNYRLTNQNEPELMLCLTGRTWYALLDLAEVYGWNPIGTLLFEESEGQELPYGGFDFEEPTHWYIGYTQGESRLVVFEDALNLADALERAFMEYEPIWTWHYEYEIGPLGGYLDRSNLSIGAITETVNFCRSGAFSIEIF